TIAAAGPDLTAAFDLDGKVAVLGEHGVRLYDASGALMTAPAAPADFLIQGPDGAALAGTVGASGIVMTPVGSTVPRFTFAPAPVSTCADAFAFSVAGD